MQLDRGEGAERDVALLRIRVGNLAHRLIRRFVERSSFRSRSGFQHRQHRDGDSLLQRPEPGTRTSTKKQWRNHCAGCDRNRVACFDSFAVSVEIF